jgi:2-dehydro-3-deoxyphosphogluconate aldolase/(4S)-4-hydroxy-2-oxoglutarate aldolase
MALQTDQFLSRLVCPVIPVIVIDRVDQAVPLAEALFSGGVSALELTLRTEVGLESIAAIKAAFPDQLVGAGTVCNGDQFREAVERGADFIVSPGATDNLFTTAAKYELPFLPGAVTGSEVMRALEYGYRTLKFFPAETSGGAAAISALAGPFGDVSFMPTGGITTDNLATYLSLKSVAAVGGSWLTPRTLLNEARWEAVHQLATETVAACRALKNEGHP